MTYRMLFSDIGGVLLTNGWDTALRNRAAAKFGIDPVDMQNRHEMVFDDFERGRLKLDEYLYHIIFYKPRDFTVAEFTDYIFNAASAYPEMIDLLKDLKAKHGLKVSLLSNEGREIADSRVKRFDLKSFTDYFIISGFVGVRKPDLRIYELALGLCQCKPSEIIYIEDRLQFVELARSFGIFAVHHVDYPKTRKILEEAFKK